MSQSLNLFTPSTRSHNLASIPTHYHHSSTFYLKPTSIPGGGNRRCTVAAFPSLRVNALSPSSDLDPVLVSGNGTGGGVLSGTSREYAAVAPAASDSSSIEVDAVTEAELKENGFRSTRRTKLVCTIGPATCGFEQLEALAVGGMNVARINMCHGTREWHRAVIDRVRRLNEEKGYAVAIMMDTEGSEIHMGDLGGASSAKAEVGFYFYFFVLLGLKWLSLFSVRNGVVSLNRVASLKF